MILQLDRCITRIALLLLLAGPAVGCHEQVAAPTVVNVNIIAVQDVDGRAPTGPGLALIGIDGTGYRWLAPDGSGSPAWLPDGSGLVFHHLLSPADEFPHIYVTHLAGDTARLIAPGGSLIAEWYPKPAPDGQWVYFTGRTASEGYGVWRARLNGTQASRIGTTPVQYGVGADRVRSVSPDGRYVIFEDVRSGAQELATLDITSGEVATLPFRGQTAEWSPRGDRIAYIDWSPGAVHTVRLDGSDDRVVSHPVQSAVYSGGLTWSPDGHFILARAIGGLHLIDAVTTETTPLAALSGSFYSPSWRPR